MKSIYSLNTIILIIVTVLIINACKKEEVPVLTTLPITNITGTSATSGGFITVEGTGPVNTRGICWSTGTYPTIADNITIDGVGSGAFMSNLTGLNGATTYYLRAYATNSYGIGYGAVLPFTTLGELPVTTNSAATDITSTAATLNGIVNASYLSTTVTFEYGTTSSYGSVAPVAQSPLTGNTDIAVNAGISGLTFATIYHYRIKAENQLGISYGDDMTFTTSVNITDYDGNIYNTIAIGEQRWMVENLKTTHYNDGGEIPFLTSSVQWSAATDGAYCAYNNNSSNLSIYGALYNWYAVNSGKLCPAGLHVPTDAEWVILSDYLGGASIAGGKMKESGTAHWTSPNTGADNLSGFTALGGSFVDWKGVFGILGQTAYWWSSTEASSTNAYAKKLFNDNASISVGGNNEKHDGFSIRCIKD
jgi:uncharacterized protein (TIGR02145 family)